MLISLISLVSVIFFSDFYLITYLVEQIEKWLNWSLRKSLINFIKTQYNLEQSSFLNLLLFNEKTQSSNQFYKNLIDNAIVYLIIIGGFHLSIIKTIIFNLFKKYKKTKNILAIIIIFFYSYLANFNISCTRVLFVLLIEIILIRRQINKFDVNSLSGFLSLILNPKIVLNYGFWMSYLCVFVIIFILKFKLDSWILNQILISILCYLICFPFVIKMNHQVSVIGFINSIVFAPLFSFVFIYELFFCWFNFLSFINQKIISYITWSTDVWKNYNFYFSFMVFNHFAYSLYYLVIFCSIITLTKKYHLYE